MVEPHEHFDYVIVGAGCAGLSLAYALVKQGLRGRRVALVDPRGDFPRDRTWCFWNVGTDVDEALVSHRFSRWRVADAREAVTVGAPGIDYCHVPSDRFYASRLAALRAEPDVTLRLGSAVRALSPRNDRVVVDTDDGRLEASLVFDSRPLDLASLVEGPGDVTLLQHFGGLEVRTARPVFDPEVVTLMDFGVEGPPGAHFVYVIPFAPDRALVEDTFFDRSPREPAVYEANIRRYLRARHGVEAFDVLHHERGVIPMTSAPIPRSPHERIVKIGVGGGLAKPSTGYAFLAIQRSSAALAASLLSRPRGATVSAPPPRRERTVLLDRIFLAHLARHPERAPETFMRLFSRAPADALVRFLSDVGSPVDDLRVIRAAPRRALSLEAARTTFSRLAPRRPG